VSANDPTTPSPLRPDESSEEAAKRRQRESERVEERFSDVSTLDEMKQELHNAGDRLVVIDIESQDECEVFDGVDRDGSKERRMEMCVQLKHSLMRCVRDCQHSMFLHVEAEVADQDLLDYLNIRHYPTIQVRLSFVSKFPRASPLLSCLIPCDTEWRPEMAFAMLSSSGGKGGCYGSTLGHKRGRRIWAPGCSTLGTKREGATRAISCRR